MPQSYSRAVALVDRLISRKGRSGVSIYRPTASSPSDPSRPWLLDNPSSPPGDALIASGLTVVFLDPREVRGQQGQFGMEVVFRSWSDMPDSLMQSTSAVALISPSQLGAAELRVGDLVVTDGRRYIVQRCDPFKPGDTLLLYTAQLRE